MRVMHLMRTYGNHGGEQQLSQLFSIKDEWSEKEFFVDLYLDKKFLKLLQKRAPHLKVFNLINFEFNPKGSWSEFFLILFLFPYLSIKLWILILREKPSLCISHGFQAGLLYWLFAIIIRKVNWIYMHRVNKKPHFRLIFKLLFSPAKLLIGNSSSVANSLNYFCDTEKIITLNNGINIEEFYKRSKLKFSGIGKDVSKTNIICVGRLLPYKGHNNILKSIKLVLKKHKVKLFVAGDGILRDAIQDQIKKLNLKEEVILLGNVDNIPSLLSKMDIFVNASVWEGMSNSVLEAMCSGLSSVVVNAPGVSECHQNFKTGYIVDNDPEIMAQKVIKLINDKKLRLMMGKLAKKRIEKYFSMEQNRSEFKNLYKKMT